MATKQETLNKALDGVGCLGRAHPDEPVFVLRAQDRLASAVVGYWADRAAEHLGHDHPKVIEALELQEKMSAWPTRKLPD